MFNTASTQQPTLNPFRLTNAIASLISVTFLISAASVEARPIVNIGQPLPTTQIIGSPIPSPILLVPGTTTPYSFSSYNDQNYNTGIMPGSRIIDNSTLINPTIINSRINGRNYQNYNTGIMPGSRIIDNSTLINPTIINSRISDSILIDPLIINSPRYPVAPFGGSRFIYTSPGIRIRLGQ